MNNLYPRLLLLIPKRKLLRMDAVYNAYNKVACLILGSMTPELHRKFEKSSPYDMINELKSMFEKQAGVERFVLIQTFHACKQEEGKSVSSNVLKMKGYVEQLERLGYVLSQDISVGLIFNGITSDFAGFVRNYNMHNIGKTIGELHALLIEYEKGLPKKAATSQVMAIQGGKIQKANKKSLNAKGKGKGKGKGKDKRNVSKIRANIATSENRGCETFDFYMDELCCGKIAISIQWDYREAISKENSGSPVNRSWNVKIPSSRRNTYIAKQHDHPIRMHVDLRTRSITFRHHSSYRKRIKVAIHPEYPEQTITIGFTLTKDGRKVLCGLLRRNLDMFT
ncbi:hypothetical protein Tco_1198425 [Tanacetum coccineum]